MKKPMAPYNCVVYQTPSGVRVLCSDSDSLRSILDRIGVHKALAELPTPLTPKDDDDAIGLYNEMFKGEKITVATDVDFVDEDED